MKKALYRPNSTLLILFFIFITLATLSCTHQNDRQDGHVYYRISANPTTLDPAYIVDVTGGSLATKIFNGLVRLDEEMNIAPDVAHSWETDESGTVYRFLLRKDVYFHNGKRVTAHDVEYSFRRILSSQTGSPNSWVLNKISGAKDFLEKKRKNLKGIKVIDDYTVELTLNTPFSPFLKLLTMPAAYIVPQSEIEREDKLFGSNPVGSGPFKMHKWDQNNELILKKNDHYFSKHSKVKGIAYRIIPEDLTAVTEFVLGNIDILEVPVSSFAMFMKEKKYSSLVTAAKGLNTYYLGFNNSKAPLNNIWLRKAIAYAIDREKILHTYYQSRGRLASGPVPDVLRRYNIEEHYEFDLKKSRQTLSKSGYGQGVTLNFYVTATQDSIDMAEIIESYLKRVGIKINIRSLEWSAYKAALNKGEADMFWISWWADYPDEENFLFPLFHSINFGAGGNRTRYENKRFDALIDMGQRALTEKERNKTFSKAENIIVKEIPCLVFWHRNDYIVRQPNILNYKIYPVYTIDKGNLIRMAGN